MRNRVGFARDGANNQGDNTDNTKINDQSHINQHQFAQSIDKDTSNKINNQEGNGNDVSNDDGRVGTYNTDVNDTKNIIQRNIRDFLMIPVSIIVLFTASFDDGVNDITSNNSSLQTKQQQQQQHDGDANDGSASLLTDGNNNKQIFIMFLITSLIGIVCHRIEAWQLSDRSFMVRYVIELFALLSSFRYHVNVHRYLVLSMDKFSLVGVVVSIPFAFGWIYHAIYFIWKLQWIIFSIFNNILTIYTSTREFPIDTKLQMMLKYSKEHHKYPINSASYKSMVQIQEDGLKAISKLKMESVNPITLIKKRVDDAVMDALLNHKDHALIQELGMAALLNLSQNSTLKGALIERGVVDLIINTLEKHEHNRKVQANAIGALRSLCSTPQNRKLMREKDIDTQLIKYHRRHIADQRIQEEVIGALRNMACDHESHSKIMDAMDTISLSLNTHLLDGGVQEQGVGLLRNLSSNKDDCNALVKGKNIIDTVLAAMLHHDNTHEDGCACIRHFAAFQDTLDIITKSEELRVKIEDVLINALLSHAEDNQHRVIEQSLGALKNLTRNYQVIYDIRSKDSFAIIVGVLSKFREYFPVVQEGCALIRNVTSYAVDKDIPLISGSNVATLLFDLMTIHRGNNKIQEHSIASLVNLMLNKFDSKALESGSRTQAILMSLTLHHNDLLVVENCMKALAIVSADENRGYQFMKNSILDQICNHIDSSIAVLDKMIQNYEDISAFESEADANDKSLVLVHQNVIKCGISILFNLSLDDKNKQIIYKKSNHLIQKCIAAYMPIVWAPFAIDNESISIVLGLLRNISSSSTIEIMNQNNIDSIKTAATSNTNPNPNDANYTLSLSVHLSSMNKYLENVLKIISVHNSEPKIMEQSLGYLRNISMQSNLHQLKSKLVDNVLMNILGRCCLPSSGAETIGVSDPRIEEQCIGAIKNFVLSMRKDKKIELRARLITMLKKSKDARVLEQIYACVRNLTLNSADSEGLIRTSEFGSGGRSMEVFSADNEEEGYMVVAPEADFLSQEAINAWTECAMLIISTMELHPADSKLQEHGCAAVLNLILNQYLGSNIFIKETDTKTNDDENINASENDSNRHAEITKLLDAVSSRMFDALSSHFMENRELTEHCLKFFGTYQYLCVSPSNANLFISNDERVFVDVLHHYGHNDVNIAKYTCWSIWSIMKAITDNGITTNLSKESKELLSSAIKESVERHKERVSDMEKREIEDLDLVQFADLALRLLA